MSDLFNNKYRISSTRLINWNYSSNGWYFITICTKNRICYFGEIINKKINLSKIGLLVKRYWEDIPKHFNNAKLDEYNILPNHIHGIIVINNQRRDGACPVSTIKTKHTLGNIIGSFKSASSNIIHKFNPDFSWQSRYYDHMIRSEYSYNKIRFYIRNNHLNWSEDKENIG